MVRLIICLVFILSSVPITAQFKQTVIISGVIHPKMAFKVKNYAKANLIDLTNTNTPQKAFSLDVGSDRAGNVHVRITSSKQFKNEKSGDSILFSVLSKDSQNTKVLDENSFEYTLNSNDTAPKQEDIAIQIYSVPSNLSQGHYETEFRVVELYN